MKIYYYVPENDRPSWGAGMIYYHVWLLSKNNFEAYVLHDNNSYKLSWLKLDISYKYLDKPEFKINNDDFFVIPEFYADLPLFRKFKCKKIVFVQNAFYIFDGLKNAKNYEDIGINCVFYYMPHLKKILEGITKLPLYETPPFVAPYFFLNNFSNKVRKLRILLYPKFDNRDYLILKRMLEERLRLRVGKSFLQSLTANRWEIVELKNKKHQEVAQEMKNATFFISLNTTEAFNSSVPEAMAAGCINICYEGVGPGDFLVNNKNSFVFPNNHVFEIVDKIFELITNFDSIQEVLSEIRENAKVTANRYIIEKLEEQLLKFFN